MQILRLKFSPCSVAASRGASEKPLFPEGLAPGQGQDGLDLRLWRCRAGHNHHAVRPSVEVLHQEPSLATARQNHLSSVMAHLLATSLAVGIISLIFHPFSSGSYAHRRCLMTASLVMNHVLE